MRFVRAIKTYYFTNAYMKCSSWCIRFSEWNDFISLNNSHEITDYLIMYRYSEPRIDGFLPRRGIGKVRVGYKEYFLSLKECECDH